VSADTFTKSVGTKQNTGKKTLVAHLRAEKELDSETVNLLLTMIDLAYSKKLVKK
jgi:hypothetical protein